MAHITGGGIVENLPRMFRDERLAALLDMDAWQRPDVFSWLQQAGNIAEAEMLRTFNCGIGFVLAVPATAADAALANLRASGEAPVLIGRLVPAGSEAGAGQLIVG
jgi:phosphoribosylformylglycinamidine cyclo-ligase